ncbi:MAG: glycosyltransferase [Bacillus sp. (in: Bacteria)]|nr:glycosyltransferase [Bacillus sp. (in: firmicutes)]MCM1427808.1 glycosyltransferase [Eubacterium sp.]
MRRIKISVIVPIYNTLDFLERCVDSIRMQTYENLEILLIDDGSTDGTGALCDTIARQDNRIRVYHKENGGASSARNFGLQNAIGDYISFIDSDDYIDTDIYQSMIDVIVENDYDIVQMSRDERDEADNRLEDVCIPPKELRFCDTETFLKELLLHQADCSFCTKLVKRELFGKYRFPEGKLNEDFKLLVPLLMKTRGVAILPVQAYHVVCRSDSTTRKHSENSFSRVFMDIVDNADEMQVLIDEHYPAIHACAIRFNLYQRLEYMLHVPIPQMNEQNDFYREVKKYLRKHILDTLMNAYLTDKNRKYLLLLTVAPKTVRKLHKAKMEKERAQESEKEAERESA